MSVIKPALKHPELIVYLSGANNYSWIHFHNGEKKLLAKPISYLEQQLPGFIRVHKTTLINPAYAKSLHYPPRQKMAGEIHLVNGNVFPVSRRRWELVEKELGKHLLAVDHPSLTKASLTDIKPDNQKDNLPAQSILLVTDDNHNAALAIQKLEKKWPHYFFHITNQGSTLPDILSQLLQIDYPVLLLLDARTATVERLQTLQRLKQQPHLRRIPIVLFVTPTDKLVTDGYKREANSVVSLKEGYLPFALAIERVCQFWLHTAALPGIVGVPQP